MNKDKLLYIFFISPSSLTSGVVRCSPGHPAELRLFPGQLELDHPVSLRESVLCLRLVLAHHTPPGQHFTQLAHSLSETHETLHYKVELFY